MFDLNKGFVSDNERFFAPLYMQGEEYSFYINFNDPVADTDFPNFKLAIRDKQGVIIADDIAELKRDYIYSTPGIYNIYTDGFTYPSSKKGQFQFVIYTNTGAPMRIKAESNWFVANHEIYAEKSSRLHYRSDINMYRFGYYRIKHYVNMFRLPIMQIDHQYETETEQYRNVSDRKFRNIKNYRDDVLKLATYLFDETAHEAFSAAIRHNTFEINGTALTQKSGYTVNTKPASNLSNGEVEMYLAETTFEDE